MKKFLSFAVVLAAIVFLTVIPAKAQPYVGEIRSVGFNFAPAGWAPCDGQLLPISEYPTLFNLIGTTYGGDGQNNFALPNLNGRVPIHQGSNPQGSTFALGQTGGTETITLTAAQMPAHTHTAIVEGVAMASLDNGNLVSPSGAVAAKPVSGINAVACYSSNNQANTTLAANTVAVDMRNTTITINSSTGSQPFNNRQPYLATNYIISLFGIYPSPN